MESLPNGVARERPTFFERRGTFWTLVGLIVVLLAARNLPFNLDDYEQAKQAYTSFEMVQDGHWLYQHTPNERIATKPPLVGWLSASIFEVTRSWELGWRLPSFAAALLLLALLARSAAAAYGVVGGVVAMCAFGLNMLSPRLATLVRTDMPLSLVIFLIGWWIWRKVRRERAVWERRDRLVLSLLLTAAMLIKGPIVCAFLLPGMLLFETWRGGRAARAWFGWWPWLLALAVFGLWVAGGTAWVPGFYDQVVVREFAGRFSETVHRPQPIYFYLPHLLHKFAPWSLLLLALAVFRWRTNRATLVQRWRGLPPETAWLICWIVGGLVVMSLVPSKRVDRIFPLVPPMCLLLAALVAQVGVRFRGWTACAVGLAAVGITGYVAYEVMGSVRNHEGALADFGTKVRLEAKARGWRYEVIGGEEEGLLLYLRKTHFVDRATAISRWNAGELEALVVPAEGLPGLLGELQNAAVSDSEATITISHRPRRYCLLIRQKLARLRAAPPQLSSS